MPSLLFCLEVVAVNFSHSDLQWFSRWTIDQYWKLGERYRQKMCVRRIVSSAVPIRQVLSFSRVQVHLKRLSPLPFIPCLHSVLHVGARARDHQLSSAAAFSRIHTHVRKHLLDTGSLTATAKLPPPGQQRTPLANPQIGKSPHTMPETHGKGRNVEHIVNDLLTGGHDSSASARLTRQAYFHETGVSTISQRPTDTQRPQAARKQGVDESGGSVQAVFDIVSQ